MKKWTVVMGVFAIGTIVHANVVGFTSAEGYSAGELGLNANWVCSGGAQFIVDPAGDGSVTLGTVAYKNASFTGGSQPSSATSYTTSALFTFEGAATDTQAAITSLFSVNFVEGTTKLQLLFRRMADGRFDIGVWDNIGSTSANANSAPDLNGSLLGLGPTLAVSDQLQASLAITRGVNETAWLYSASLYNVDTASTLASLSGTFESTLTFFQNDVVAGFSSSALASASNVSSLKFQEFSITSVPEPATLSLVGMVAAGLFLVRRLMMV